MGESPQEKAASELQGRVYDRVNTYGAGGSENYLTRMSSINPYISNALTALDKSAADARAYGSAQLGGIRGSAGSTLVEGGVAPGGQINSAFLSAIAPAIGEISKYVGQVEGQKAGVQMTAADLIKSLMLNQDQTISSLLGVENSAIGQMKDSTLTGDILGVATTGLNIATGLWGAGAPKGGTPKGLFK